MNKWRKKHDVKFGKIRFGETLIVAKKTKGDARNLETTVRNGGPFLRVAYIFSEPENGHTFGASLYKRCSDDVVSGAAGW